jgi:pilus assembly protein Flp/PilA
MVAGLPSVSKTLQSINGWGPAMQKYLDQTLEFLKDEAGATATEYALLASLIAGVIVLAVTALGQSVLGLFQSVSLP